MNQLLTQLLLSYPRRGASKWLRYLVAKSYLEILREARKSIKVVLGILFLLVLSANGIILAAAGLVMLAPVPMEQRGWICFAMGLVLLGMAAILYGVLCSERLWIKAFRVEETLNRISGKKVSN